IFSEEWIPRTTLMGSIERPDRAVRDLRVNIIADDHRTTSVATTDRKPDSTSLPIDGAKVGSLSVSERDLN
ncbi:MAG: hypothetical protein OXC93_15185, partial [Rhodospirillaceae bacterium]|nr:hypothetical protein [Rhodospirillaceae bacterium]